MFLDQCPIFLLSLSLLVSALAGCTTSIEEASPQRSGFEAVYISDSNRTQKWVLGGPKLVQSSGGLGEYLPLSVASGTAESHGIYWLDRDLKTIRNEALCRNNVYGFDGECAEDAAFWDLAGSPSELCLDIAHLHLGEHLLEYDLGGLLVKATVTVAALDDGREVRILPNQSRTFNEQRCVFNDRDPAPVEYTDSFGTTWHLQTLNVGEALDMDNVNGPRPPPLVHENEKTGFKWFPGEEIDPWETGYSARNIIDAFVYQHADAQEAAEEGCLGLFSLIPLDRGFTDSVPGVKIGEGEIRFIDSEGVPWQWGIAVHRGIQEPEVRAWDVDSDSSASCHSAEAARLSMIEAMRFSSGVVDRGAEISYKFAVVTRPAVQMATQLPQSYFTIIYRPDYVDSTVHSSYTPYQMKLKAADGQLVHVVLHPEDMDRLDATRLNFAD